jgi:hypothetical protein
MIPKNGYRFSEKIMHNDNDARGGLTARAETCEVAAQPVLGSIPC